MATLRVDEPSAAAAPCWCVAGARARRALAAARRGRSRSTRWRGSCGAARRAGSRSTRRAGRPGSRSRSLFTTPLALFGGAAPALWLIVARAGGLLALAGAFALAARLGGRWAGVAAAAVMALSPWWLFNTALGNSEGLLAAAVLWAVVAHLAGRAARRARAARPPPR